MFYKKLDQNFTDVILLKLNKISAQIGGYQATNKIS